MSSQQHKKSDTLKTYDVYCLNQAELAENSVPNHKRLFIQLSFNKNIPKIRRE